MVGFAAFKVGRDIAEDLAQETLLLIHEKYSAVERMEELLPLAFRILRFKMVSQQRKSIRRGEYDQVQAEEWPIAGDEPDPEMASIHKEGLEKLLKGISRMPPRCRELFRLKLDGLGFGEIQVALGAETLNTVYTWDHRCRKQLMERIGGRWAT
jgi:RNA polymerase sigma-70 factor (ECF subfamily)